MGVFFIKAAFERAGRRGFVVDVGANVGNVCFHAARVLAEVMQYRENMLNQFTVVAFEPNPENAKRIEQEISRREALLGDGFAPVKVKVVNAAVSNESGDKMFFHRGIG